MQVRLATASQLQISKVGFPIRKSADQSLFAAPHGLSQRTTSFIASQRQGIHRIPLRHLIALITNAHRSAAKRPVAKDQAAALAEKTSFASNTPESAAVKPRPRLGCSKMTAAALGSHDLSIGCIPSSRCQIGPRRVCRRLAKISSFKDGGRPATPGLWWSQTGSNRRPHACKARALPTELWPRCDVMNWWAWEDLNLRPHAYQARALTN